VSPTAERAVTIRAAGQADLPAIDAIYDRAVASGVATCDLSGLTPGERQRWLGRQHGVWIADLEGEAVGWVSLFPYDAKPCFARTASLATYVDDRHRRRSIGRELRQRAIDEARAMGFHALISRVWATNAASIGLARSFGWREVGRLPEVVCLDGRYVDCVLFHFTLEETG
jgi:L-amino acid N-acyltransferase